MLVRRLATRGAVGASRSGPEGHETAVPLPPGVLKAGFHSAAAEPAQIRRGFDGQAASGAGVCTFNTPRSYVSAGIACPGPRSRAAGGGRCARCPGWAGWPWGCGRPGPGGRIGTGLLCFRQALIFRTAPPGRPDPGTGDQIRIAAAMVSRRPSRTLVQSAWSTLGSPGWQTCFHISTGILPW